MAEPRFVRGAFGAGLALAFAVLILYSGRDWPKYRRLYDSGTGADGWVTGKDLSGGRRVDYAFRVGERLYSGSTLAGSDEFGRLSPDDPVVIFYLPQDPAVSCLGDPKDRLQAQNRALVLPLLAAAGVLAWYLSRELLKASD